MKATCTPLSWVFAVVLARGTLSPSPAMARA
jgi:hypothetical protein